MAITGCPCLRVKLPLLRSLLTSYRRPLLISPTRRCTELPVTGSFTRLYSRAMSSSEGTNVAASTGAAVVYVTVPSQEVGEKLAGILVNPHERLAACVNILPGLTSIYWWEGKVNKDAELLLIIKTRMSLVQKLTEVVKSNHPYEECEVISLPITGGSPSYINWIFDSTRE